MRWVTVTSATVVLVAVCIGFPIPQESENGKVSLIFQETSNSPEKSNVQNIYKEKHISKSQDTSNDQVVLNLQEAPNAQETSNAKDASDELQLLCNQDNYNTRKPDKPKYFKLDKTSNIQNNLQPQEKTNEKYAPNEAKLTNNQKKSRTQKNFDIPNTSSELELEKMPNIQSLQISKDALMELDIFDNQSESNLPETSDFEERSNVISKESSQAEETSNVEGFSKELDISEKQDESNLPEMSDFEERSSIVSEDISQLEETSNVEDAPKEFDISDDQDESNLPEMSNVEESSSIISEDDSQLEETSNVEDAPKELDIPDDQDESNLPEMSNVEESSSIISEDDSQLEETSNVEDAPKELDISDDQDESNLPEMSNVEEKSSIISEDDSQLEETSNVEDAPKELDIPEKQAESELSETPDFEERSSIISEDDSQLEETSNVEDAPKELDIPEKQAESELSETPDFEERSSIISEDTYQVKEVSNVESAPKELYISENQDESNLPGKPVVEDKSSTISKETFKIEKIDNLQNGAKESSIFEKQDESSLPETSSGEDRSNTLSKEPSKVDETSNVEDDPNELESAKNQDESNLLETLGAIEKANIISQETNKVENTANVGDAPKELDLSDNKDESNLPETSDVGDKSIIQSQEISPYEEISDVQERATELNRQDEFLSETFDFEDRSNITSQETSPIEEIANEQNAPEELNLQNESNLPNTSGVEDRSETIYKATSQDEEAGLEELDISKKQDESILPEMADVDESSNIKYQEGFQSQKVSSVRNASNELDISENRDKLNIKLNYNLTEPNVEVKSNIENNLEHVQKSTQDHESYTVKNASIELSLSETSNKSITQENLSTPESPNLKERSNIQNSLKSEEVSKAQDATDGSNEAVFSANHANKTILQGPANLSEAYSLEDRTNFQSNKSQENFPDQESSEVKYTPIKLYFSDKQRKPVIQKISNISDYFSLEKKVNNEFKNISEDGETVNVVHESNKLNSLDGDKSIIEETSSISESSNTEARSNIENSLKSVLSSQVASNEQDTFGRIEFSENQNKTIIPEEKFHSKVTVNVSTEQDILNNQDKTNIPELSKSSDLADTKFQMISKVQGTVFSNVKNENKYKVETPIVKENSNNKTTPALEYINLQVSENGQDPSTNKLDKSKIKDISNTTGTFDVQTASNGQESSKLQLKPDLGEIHTEQYKQSTQEISEGEEKSKNQHTSKIEEIFKIIEHSVTEISSSTEEISREVDVSNVQVPPTHNATNVQVNSTAKETQTSKIQPASKLPLKSYDIKEKDNSHEKNQEIVVGNNTLNGEELHKAEDKTNIHQYSKIKNNTNEQKIHNTQETLKELEKSTEQDKNTGELTDVKETVIGNNVSTADETAKIQNTNALQENLKVEKTSIIGNTSNTNLRDLETSNKTVQPDEQEKLATQENYKVELKVKINSESIDKTPEIQNTLKLQNIQNVSNKIFNLKNKSNFKEISDKQETLDEKAKPSLQDMSSVPESPTIEQIYNVHESLKSQEDPPVQSSFYTRYPSNVQENSNSGPFLEGFTNNYDIIQDTNQPINYFPPLGPLLGFIYPKLQDSSYLNEKQTSEGYYIHDNAYFVPVQNRNNFMTLTAPKWIPAFTEGQEYLNSQGLLNFKEVDNDRIFMGTNQHQINASPILGSFLNSATPMIKAISKIQERSKIQATANVQGSSQVEELSQAEGTSETVEPSQAEGTSKTVEPSQAEGTSKTVEPSQAEGTSKTVEPSQAEGTSKTVEPSQAEGTSKTVEPSQIQETYKTEEPSQVQETSKIVEPSQIQETSKIVEPSQAEGTSKIEELSKVQNFLTIDKQIPEAFARNKTTSSEFQVRQTDFLTLLGPTLGPAVGTLLTPFISLIGNSVTNSLLTAIMNGIEVDDGSAIELSEDEVRPNSEGAETVEDKLEAKLGEIVKVQTVPQPYVYVISYPPQQAETIGTPYVRSYIRIPIVYQAR